MTGFEDLKIPDELLTHLRDLGFLRPSSLQREAVPAIARGTTVVGVASAGSGKTLGYGLGLGIRLDATAAGPQALVLRPTDDRAAATADALFGLLHRQDLTVAVVRPHSRSDAHIVVASPSAVLTAIEHSAIKLDGLKVIVVDGVSAMIELGAQDDLETLISHIPKEAQRVLLTSVLTPPVEDYIDRHARRARRLTYLPAEAPQLSEATLEYYAAPKNLWLSALTRSLEARAAKGSARSTVRCRLESEAKALTSLLTVRGFDTSSEARWLTVEAKDPTDIEPPDTLFWWGAPLDLEDLHSGIQDSRRAVAFVEPPELPHLQRLAGTLALRLTALKTTPPKEAHRSAQQTQDQLHQAIAERDLEPYVLLIESLLDEYAPIQVAAAATALFRERLPTASAKPLPAWTRLYFGVGRRDGVRPADFVGAITGESPVTGDRIGRIEIRDTYSSVEVAASVADQVIKSLATATIRGRPANVRVFRE
jgi:ATP-dependent RNA helicase DeaD